MSLESCQDEDVREAREQLEARLMFRVYGLGV